MKNKKLESKLMFEIITTYEPDNSLKKDIYPYSLRYIINLKK